MMRALVLLAFLHVQDSDIGALLKQLEDESIETREKAAATLVALGDKAEERVKKHLDSMEGEVKARCESILRAIHSKRRLAEVLPPLKRVTLDAKDARLRDVLEDLQKQSGMSMRLDGLGDSTVTVQVKDAAPLEALDAVCKAAELGWFIDGSFVKGRMPPPAFGDDLPVRGATAIRFQSGGYIDVPRFFARHYSVSPSNLQINRWTDFRTVSSSASLQLRLNWTPETKPENAWFEVKRVTDDKGRTLFEPAKGAMAGKFRAHMMGGGIHRSQMEIPIQLTFPEADAKAIGSVKGTATARFVVAEKTLVFDSPEGAPTAAKDYEGLTVELVECRTHEGAATVKLAMRGRSRQAAPDGVHYHQTPPVRLKLEDGTTAPGTGTTIHSDGTTSRYDLTFHRVTSKIAAVEVVVDTTYHTDTFDFELKDIPLPK